MKHTPTSRPETLLSILQHPGGDIVKHTPTLTATAAPSTRSPWNEEQWRHDVARCRVEVAGIEALLRAGHPDVEGLVLALADWSEELRMIAREKKKAASG